MKRIPNIEARLKKLKEDAQELHNIVFKTFKEIGQLKGIDVAPLLKDDFIYSIGCGKYFSGYYSHQLFYMGGVINLYSMSFDVISRHIASWKSIEKFKSEIANYFK